MEIDFKFEFTSQNISFEQTAEEREADGKIKFTKELSDFLDWTIHAKHENLDNYLNEILELHQIAFDDLPIANYPIQISVLFCIFLEFDADADSDNKLLSIKSREFIAQILETVDEFSIDEYSIYPFQVLENINQIFSNLCQDSKIWILQFIIAYLNKMPDLFFFEEYECNFPTQFNEFYVNEQMTEFYTETFKSFPDLIFNLIDAIIVFTDDGYQSFFFTLPFFTNLFYPAHLEPFFTLIDTFFLHSDVEYIMNCDFTFLFVRFANPPLEVYDCFLRTIKNILMLTLDQDKLQILLPKAKSFMDLMPFTNIPFHIGNGELSFSCSQLYLDIIITAYAIDQSFLDEYASSVIQFLIIWLENYASSSPNSKFFLFLQMILTSIIEESDLEPSEIQKRFLTDFPNISKLFNKVPKIDFTDTIFALYKQIKLQMEMIKFVDSKAPSELSHMLISAFYNKYDHQ